MTSSSIVQPRWDSVGRQAKKLSAVLEISLTRAQKVLACALYRCGSWNDLLQRLSARDPNEHIIRLVELPASQSAAAYFQTVRNDLANALAQYHLANANLLGLAELLHEVFAVPSDGPNLRTAIPVLETSRWRSANIGPDPEAVLYSEADVGGVRLKLFATRVYLPEFYDFGDDLQPEYAVPHGELLKIIWADPKAWRQAAKNYAEDADAEEVSLPETRLTESMSLHQAFFERCLVGLGHSRFYGGGDETVVPLLLRGSAYLVYGHPMARCARVNQADKRAVLPKGDGDSDYRVVLVDETPVVLEWIAFDPSTGRHPGERAEYLEALKGGLISRAPFVTTTAAGIFPGLLMVQPADTFHVRNAIKVEFTHEPGQVALVLQTDAVEATSLVLEYVVRRRLTSVSSEMGSGFVAELSLSSEVDVAPPSLSLTISSEGRWSSEHLIRSSRVSEDSGAYRAVLDISPRLLKVVDLIGQKVVERAIREGQVLRFPANFLKELDEPPARSTRLPIASPEVLDVAPIPLDALFQVSSIRYHRRNL